MHHVSYRYRYYPTKKQESLLLMWLVVCVWLYNACLEERKRAREWKRNGWLDKLPTYESQTVGLTKTRANDPLVQSVPVHVARSAVQRCHRTDQAMWSAWKAGKKFRPRFKNRDQYTSFDYPAPKRLLQHEPGDRMARIRLPGAGGWAKIRYHREMVGEPIQVTVTRSGDVWHIIVLCEVNAELPAQQDPACVTQDRCVGIDVGIRYIAALSNGDIVHNPRFARGLEHRIARKQRELARKKRGSSSRRRAKERLRKAYAHLAEKRKHHISLVAKDIVGRFDLIAHEDLSISRMVHGNLAGAIYDASWRALLNAIVYKAARAGKRVVAVDPCATSQTCSACGAHVPKGLSTRWHQCECGASLCRDVNAAKNILARGLDALCVSADHSAGAKVPTRARRPTKTTVNTVAQS